MQAGIISLFVAFHTSRSHTHTRPNSNTVGLHPAGRAQDIKRNLLDISPVRIHTPRPAANLAIQHRGHALCTSQQLGQLGAHLSPLQPLSGQGVRRCEDKGARIHRRRRHDAVVHMCRGARPAAAAAASRAGRARGRRRRRPLLR